MKKQQRKTQKNKYLKKRRGGSGIKSTTKTSSKHSKGNPKYPPIVELTDDNFNKFVKHYIYDRKNELPLNLKNLPIGKWDVSKVTNMQNLFANQKTFNEDISEWDVSNVTNMDRMFENAKNFNQDISEWDVSNVKQSGYMFNGATNFEQDLNLWNTRKNKYMAYMFQKAPKMKVEYIERWEFPEAIDDVVNRVHYGDRLVSIVFNRYIYLTEEQKEKLKEENEKLREPMFRKKTFKERKPFLELIEETDKEYKKGNRISTEPQISKFLENEDWNKALMEYIDR